jgi:DNA-binding winged helix-turn-helix (wHTH) protein
LSKRPGEVVRREELRSQLWGSDTFIDFDNGLNTLINKLREALGDSLLDIYRRGALIVLLSAINA